MQTIYRVILGEFHVVKSTLNYEEAKENFLLWVEAFSWVEAFYEVEKVSYNCVTLTADHVPVLEFIKK